MKITRKFVSTILLCSLHNKSRTIQKLALTSLTSSGTSPKHRLVSSLLNGSVLVSLRGGYFLVSDILNVVNQGPVCIIVIDMEIKALDLKLENGKK